MTEKTYVFKIDTKRINRLKVYPLSFRCLVDKGYTCSTKDIYINHEEGEELLNEFYYMPKDYFISFIHLDPLTASLKFIVCSSTFNPINECEPIPEVKFPEEFKYMRE